MDDSISRICVPMTESGFYIQFCLQEPQHGYGSSQQIKRMTGGSVAIGAGTMYGTLSKTEQDGLICICCAGWLLFRKPAATVEAGGKDALFPDSVSQRDLASRIARTRLMPLAILFFSCMIPNPIRVINGRMGSLNGFLVVFFGFMFGRVCIFDHPYCSIKLKRIRRKHQPRPLSTGIPGIGLYPINSIAESQSRCDHCGHTCLSFGGY